MQLNIALRKFVADLHSCTASHPVLGHRLTNLFRETQIDKSLAPLHLFLRTFEPVRQSNGTVARSSLYTIYTPQESCRSGNLFEKGKTIVRTFIHQPFTSTTTLVSTSANWWVGWQPSKGFAIWQVFLPEICLNFFPKTEVWTLQHHGRCTQIVLAKDVSSCWRFLAFALREKKA